MPSEVAAPWFPIVGIGASAGGLAAFEAFFSAMPADTESGMAFVLVQHLSPDQKTTLTDLVRRCTRMQVFEVEDGMTVQPNCAYVIPPDRDMAFLNGTLRLLEPSTPRGLRLPIDFFFRSLAQDQREQAICIVLSGAGSDGTLGVRAVRGEGGMVMVQDPDSADYDSMPRSAIAMGLADYVLPPAEMPAQLIAYVAHAFAKRLRPLSAPTPRSEDTLKKICVLLRSRTGHDFSGYKGSTIIRRIERRMALHQIEQREEYLRYLEQVPAEVETLYRDLLISVTSFFRDPEAFAALQTQVIPRLFAGKPAGGVVRVWVCGCSTGEEAYSIAILIKEHLETLKQSFKVRIFATDVDRQAVGQARSGIFPVSIAAHVSPQRLSRFFALDPDGGVYRIQKVIRDLLVFSEHDLLIDPPFSRLDLISCRNLLIYMSGERQKKLISLFHYALNPGGALFLGTSETVADAATLFAVLDCKWKLHLRQADVPGAFRPGVGALVPPLSGVRAHPRPLQEEGQSEGSGSLRELTEQALLQHCAPAGVLVNGRGEILHIYGRTGKYLEPAPGDAGLNVLSMAREGLRRELTAALHRAVAQKEVARYPGLRVRTNGEIITVHLTVRPVAAGPVEAAKPGLFLVILEDVSPGDPDLPGKAAAEGAGTPDAGTGGRIAELEQELRAKEEYLHITLEETETSKEELQSLNEELLTVNAELQTTVSDLSRANNDMSNLLAGTGVATLFVDHQLRILRFTPAVTQLINLIQTDIGRPVGHIVSNLAGYDRLVEDVQSVLGSLVPQETEVQTRAGAWYLMRILPYRSLNNAVEGAGITFVDVSERKRAYEALRQSEEMLKRTQEIAHVGSWVLDLENDALTWSDEVYRIFGLQPQEFGATDAAFLAAVHPDDRAAVEAAYSGSLREGRDTYEIEHRVVRKSSGEIRIVHEKCKHVRNAAGRVIRSVGMVQDITERKRAENAQETSR